MPKISIVMPVHNEQDRIAKAIDSVLRQSFFDWELVIVNDASTDKTLDAIKAYGDNRIKIFTNEEKKGLTASLNRGLSESSGVYIARLDADDIWLDSDKLRAQVNFLEHNPDHALVGTWTNVVDTGGRFLYQLAYPRTDNQIRNKILSHNCFVHSSVMYGRQHAIELGGYDNDIRVEDYDLWLRIGTTMKFANLDQVMTQHTYNPMGVTYKKNLERVRFAMLAIKKYQKNYPNFFRSYAKWLLQYYFVLIFGTEIFIKLKSYMRSS